MDQLDTKSKSQCSIYQKLWLFYIIDGLNHDIIALFLHQIFIIRLRLLVNKARNFHFPNWHYYTNDKNDHIVTWLPAKKPKKPKKYKKFIKVDNMIIHPLFIVDLMRKNGSSPIIYYKRQEKLIDSNGTWTSFMYCILFWWMDMYCYGSIIIISFINDALHCIKMNECRIILVSALKDITISPIDISHDPRLIINIMSDYVIVLFSDLASIIQEYYSIINNLYSIEQIGHFFYIIIINIIMSRFFLFLMTIIVIYKKYKIRKQMIYY